MKIVLDMNLSPAWIPLLESGGHEVRHWSQIGYPNAPDTDIMDWASNHGFAVLTHDLDYGAILFATKAKSPSVIQLRIEDVRPNSIGKEILETLVIIEEPIKRGSLVTINPRKNRIQLLPLGKK